MRIVPVLFLAIGFVLAFAPPGFAEQVDSGVPGMIFEHNVSVTMSDGLVLRANIYRPDKPGRFPVVMLMGPYGKDTSYADAPPYKLSWARLTAKYPELCKKSSCRFMRWEAPDPERWIPDGYIIIHADSRGTGASPGMLDPFSPRGTEDFANLITWAARQPWSSGKVGLLGTSYHAINQWQVAARQPEGLAAMIPWEGAFDLYREIAYYDGIPNLIPNASGTFWWDHQVVPNQNGNAATPFVDAVTGHKSTGDPLSPELLKQNRTSPVDALLSHPLDGAFYHDERTPDPSRILVPFLDVANWEGWSTEGYVAAASKSKWLRIQTGDHLTPFYSEEALALQKRFFDHFLKGEDNGWEKELPVSLAIRRPGGISWRKEAAWPLPGTKWERFYLNTSNGVMSSAKSTAAAEKSYQGMSEGITFNTRPFVQEAEFTGPVKLKLWVRSTTADMDIFATLRLIDPEGRELTFNGGVEPRVPATQGYLRVSHRALDSKHSTEYRPHHPNLVSEPMTPGQFYEVDVAMGNNSLVVPKGYRLALTVEGQDWVYAADAKTVPSHDWELPGTETPHFTSLRAHAGRDPTVYGGTNTIGTGSEHESYLLLPLIPARR